MSQRRRQDASVWRLVVITAVAGCDAGAVLGRCDYSPQFAISGVDSGTRTTSAYVPVPTQPFSAGRAAEQAPADDGVSTPGEDIHATSTSTAPGPGYSVIYRDYEAPPESAREAPSPSSSLPAPTTRSEQAEASAPEPQYSESPPATEVVIIPSASGGPPASDRPIAPRPVLNGGTVYDPTPAPVPPGVAYPSYRPAR
jgi:hypothetical protein